MFSSSTKYAVIYNGDLSDGCNQITAYLYCITYVTFSFYNTTEVQEVFYICAILPVMIYEQWSYHHW